MTPNRVVACDFDGVVHAYTDGWVGHVPAAEPPPAGLVDFFMMLAARDLDIVIHSCRAITPEGKVGIEGWLAEHGLAEFVKAVTAEKPFAIAYLDDRAVSFSGDWLDALEQIEALAAHPVGVPPRA